MAIYIICGWCRFRCPTGNCPWTSTCSNNINDLPPVTSEGTTVKLFADDSAVYRNIRTFQDCLTLQNDLDNIQRWENDNFMEFHPDKCQLLRVTNKRNPITLLVVSYGITLPTVMLFMIKWSRTRNIYQTPFKV